PPPTSPTPSSLSRTLRPGGHARPAPHVPLALPSHDQQQTRHCVLSASEPRQRGVSRQSHPLPRRSFPRVGSLAVLPRQRRCALCIAHSSRATDPRIVRGSCLSAAT